MMQIQVAIFYVLFLYTAASELSKMEDIPLGETWSIEKSDQDETQNGFQPSRPIYSEHWTHPISELPSENKHDFKLLYNSRDGDVHKPSNYIERDKSYYSSASNDYHDNYGSSGPSYVPPEESTNYGEAKITNFPLRPKDYQNAQGLLPRPIYNDNGYPYGVRWQGGGYDSTFPGYEENKYGGSTTGKLFSYIKNGFGKENLSLLLGLVPIALLIASLVPKFVMVPVQGVTAGNTRSIAGALSRLSGRRRREVPSNPVLDLIDEYGVRSLENPSCLKRIACQVARQGRGDGNVVQKIFYLLANAVSEKSASYFGFKNLIKAIKRGKCEAFYCPHGRQEGS